MSEALQVLQCCSVLQLGASLQSLQDDDPVLTSVIGVKLQPKVPAGANRGNCVFLGQTLGLMSDTWADAYL